MFLLLFHLAPWPVFQATALSPASPGDRRIAQALAEFFVGRARRAPQIEQAVRLPAHRAELLNVELLMDLMEAKTLGTAWRLQYNRCGNFNDSAILHRPQHGQAGANNAAVSKCVNFDPAQWSLCACHQNGPRTVAPSG